MELFLDGNFSKNSNKSEIYNKQKVFLLFYD